MDSASPNREVRPSDSKAAPAIQDTFLNTVRKEKTPVMIYLVSGVKLTGTIRSFDKYSVVLENDTASNSQGHMIYKHAIATVTIIRARIRTEDRDPSTAASGSSSAPVTSAPIF